MITSSLFLLVNEDGQLIAYPCIVQTPTDEDGYRYTNFVPLAETKYRPPSVISIVHKNSLHLLGDVIIIKEYETAPDKDDALTLLLSNMLVGQRYLYQQLDPTEMEQEYTWLVQSICHLMLRILKESPSQKSLLNALSIVFNRYLPVLNITHREAMDFMQVVDSIIEDTIDENGFITIESVNELLDSLGNEEPEHEFKQTQYIADDDEDSDFFVNLFK